MFDLFLGEGFFPFTLSLALFFGLLALELLFIFMGATLFGDGAGGPDGHEIDAPEMEFDVDLDGLGIDAADYDLADLDGPEAHAPEGSETADGSPGLLNWLGFGKMPAAIWLASVLMAFGLFGLTVQGAVKSTLGFALPWSLVALPAAAASLWFARQFGGLFARLLPKTETEALSERHLGRRMGVVSQGTAARGRPAEVRVTDRYGNAHYLRAEPLRDDETIAQGTEVLVMWARKDGSYRLITI